MKYFIYSIIAIVIATIIGGFLIVGSPQQERLRRFDDERVNNLQFIQSEIINYWLNKGALPAKLSNLEDNIRGVVIPKDPQTGADYQYNITGKLSFSICANFGTTNAGSPSIPKLVPAKPAGYYDSINQNWQHDAGQICFDRTIDKDFYKPIQPK